MTLRIDYSNMMISPGGIDPAVWGASAKQFEAAKRKFDELRSGGSVGFVDLPSDRALLAQVEKFASSARGKYDDVVILGIGGSALGPIALRTSLRPSGWNLLDDKARGAYPRARRGGPVRRRRPRADTRSPGTRFPRVVRTGWSASGSTR